MVVVVVVEFVGSPIAALSDAAVMGAASTDGCYGTSRLWACVTYNTSGIISSVLMHVADDSAVFVAYAATALLAVLSAARLDMTIHLAEESAYSRPLPVAAAGQQSSYAGAAAPTKGRSGHAHGSSGCEVEQPLLPPEQDTDGPTCSAAAPSHDSKAHISLSPAGTTANACCGAAAGAFFAGERTTTAVPGLHHHGTDPEGAGHEAIAPDGRDFSAKLTSLLQDPRVIGFLATACLMGVRHSPRFCR